MHTSNILKQKLDRFIDKYYQNQLYKGLILAVSLSLLLLFAISALEFLGRFGSATRLTLFVSYVFLVASILFWYVIRPLIGLLNLSRALDRSKAAKLIGRHFPEVSDKLLNALQLQELNPSSNSLLLASIEQKTNELSPIRFTKAINFKENWRYFKYALVPAIGLFLVLVVSPGFKNSTERVVKYNEEFVAAAPFQFIIDPDDLIAVQNESVLINLELKGQEIPYDAYLYLDGVRFKMSREDNGNFSQSIPNIQRSSDIYFEAGSFDSEKFRLEVMLKPSLMAYEAQLIYPSYLQRTSETVRNIGEITIPEGTQIVWRFNTRHVNTIRFADEEPTEISNNRAEFKKTFNNSSAISIHTSNAQMPEGDSLQYNIKVIPDAYPDIHLQTIEDSLSSKILYFTGGIEDDYGFSNLVFHYEHIPSSDTVEGSTGKIEIPIKKNIERQAYYHIFNMDILDVAPEDIIHYYFTVWDNDGVNGAKSSSTTKRTFKAPSIKDLEEETEKANEEIKNSLGGSKSEAEQLADEIQNAEKMLTEKKHLEWKDRKKIEDLLKKQEALQKQIDETVKQNMQKNFKEEEFSNMSERLQDKQKKLEELFNEIMDDEMKSLMEEIRKLMDENKTDELQKAMEEFKLSEQEMNKELDRMLELFKELELEKKLEQTIDKLNELAKKQHDLANKTVNKKESKEELQKQQDELNKELNDIREDLQDIDKKNQDLETPKDLSPPEEKTDDVKQDMNDAKSDIQKGKNKKANKHQKDAAEKLQEMAKELQTQMEEAYEEQNEEDYQALRQILENLIQLSFDQEEVQAGFKANKQYSPKYIELRQEQRRILDESKLVEDSLLALSKRVVVIQQFVNDEIARINHGHEKSLHYLGERLTSDALVHQQHVMTGYNNLALMLSASLKDMQEQMAADKENKGKPKSQCKKPGGKKGKNSKPSMSAIKKMQKELAKQLKEMKQGMQKGKKPGSKQFGEMAAKQAAIRQKMRDLERQLQKEGEGGALGDLKRTQDLMDEIEKDLYYKNISEQSMRRLRQIEIQLSQHEKAEQEKEQDQKRSSKEGQDQVRELPPELQKYLDEKAKELEQLKQVSPELNPYYEKKVKKYFEK